MKNQHRLSFFVVAVATAVLGPWGCGGKTVEPTAELSVETGSSDEFEGSAGGTQGAKIEGVEATVSWDDVETVFNQREQELYDCYNKAVEEVEEVEGKIEFAIQAGDGGKVVDVHVKTSDLGSLEAEECMTAKIGRFKFRLQGQGIATFTKSMAFQAPYDPAKPALWGEQVTNKIVDERRADVERCLGGQTGIDLTLYVGRGGVVLSSGVATSGSELKDEAHCLARASRGWTFPDPGGETAKVELSF